VGPRYWLDSNGHCMSVLLSCAASRSRFSSRAPSSAGILKLLAKDLDTSQTLVSARSKTSASAPDSSRASVIVISPPSWTSFYLSSRSDPYGIHL